MENNIQLLPSKWVSFLVETEESCTNCHKVDIVLKNGKIVENVVIANCQYIMGTDVQIDEIERMKIK